MGGVENQLLSFLKKYDRAMFEIDVLCTTSTSGALREEYLSTGSLLLYCRWSRYVFPFVFRLLILLRRNRYDVIHSRTSEISGAVMLAAWFAGIRVRIASYHHTEIRWRKPGVLNKFVIRILQFLTAFLATKILGVSETCLNIYFPKWRSKGDQFAICYNGIDTERFSDEVVAGEIRKELSLPEESIVIGHVGSFREVKNHKTIINMAEILLKEFENLYFLLVGDGGLRRKVENEVALRGLKDRFLFVGNRNDVARMLSAMDIFVMPSYFEGFPSAVTEAQFSGLVVIGSNAKSIREALYPPLREYCCDPEDFEAMSNNVKMFIKDAALRKERGSLAREYVAEKFSMETLVKQLQEVYKAQ